MDGFDRAQASYDNAQASYDAMQPPDWFGQWECEHRRCDTVVSEDDHFCRDHRCARPGCENGIDEDGDDRFCEWHQPDEED